MTSYSGQPRSLGVLIRKNFLTAALVPLLLIELALIVMYFGTSTYLTRAWTDGVVDTVRQGMEASLWDCVDNLQAKLQEVERTTAVVQKQTTAVVLGHISKTSTQAPPAFAVADNGAFYKVHDNGGSSLFYSAPTKIGDAERAKAITTEALDPLFKLVTDANPNIIATYYNTYDDMNRYYPFVNEVYRQFPADLKMEKFNFYYEADAAHNPDRKVVWTDAYLDPAGQGWMISCVAPVYRDDFLEGVVGLDVTVASLADQLLELGLPWKHAAMLVDENGTLMAMNAAAEALTGIEELKRHTYDGVVNQETLKPESFQLGQIQNRSLGQKALEVLKSGKSFSLVDVNGHQYGVAFRKLGIRSWTLLIFVDQAVVRAPVDRLAHMSNQLGLTAMGAIAVFYAVFLLFILRSSRRLADRVVHPVRQLITRTQNPAHDTSSHLSGVQEIDALSQSFDHMLTEIESRTRQIETLNQSLEQRVNTEVEKNREKDHLLLEQSRLATMGEMIGAISHQWRQPLTALRLMLSEVAFDLKQDTLDAPTAAETFEDADELVVHMSQTIDDFRDLCAPAGPVTPFALEEAIQKTVMLTDATMKLHGVTLNAELAPGLVVEGRRNELCQVLLNLVHNARDVIVERSVPNGCIHIRTDQESGLKMIVEDNGGGIDETVAESLFDAYFTTRAGGTGLGLYMSRRIVEERFDGKLYVEPGKEGARFVIQFARPSPN